MGEEDKLEPTEAKEVEEENLSAKVIRKRKKQLHNSIRDLMEFWFSDVNLGKDRFLSQLIFANPWVDLEIFLKFNKLRALTMNLNDIVKALRKSEMLQVSEDGTKVCRTTPFGHKEDADACTIYVEQIQPDAEHDWLKSVFSEFGPIDYISLPRFKATQKPKGFAFIEFKTAESANKAIEAFRAKGCCLSPQMDPDKLASIATFEKDNKQFHDQKNTVYLDEEILHCDTKQEISPQNLKIEENEEPESETENKEVGKIKTLESGLRDDDTVNHRQKRLKSNIDQNEEEIAECKIDDDNSKEKKSKKRKKRMSDDNELVAENEEENYVSGEKSTKRSKVTLSSETEVEETNTKKGKRISDASLEAEENELTNMEAFAEEKDFESIQEIESERDDYEEKKKRKRRKKHKKIVSAISFGLQIMPKVEWKRLRNTYLNMQKQKMKQLKQHMRQFPYGQRTPKWQSYNYEDEGVNNKIDVDKNGTDRKKGLEYTPGVIIKVILDEPVLDVKGIKSSARIHPEVRYVDANEGDKEIYLRVGAPELADQVLTTKHWSHMELLQGKEEKQYWDKIMKDREEKFSKKIRVNRRGRDKLLKKAEKIQGKHVGFDER